jgi:hypothetical protein
MFVNPLLIVPGFNAGDQLAAEPLNVTCLTSPSSKVTG